MGNFFLYVKGFCSHNHADHQQVLDLLRTGNSQELVLFSMLQKFKPKNE
jgi:metal-dependent hydrolase (beta-lactamase superfamily II)